MLRLLRRFAARAAVLIGIGGTMGCTRPASVPPTTPDSAAARSHRRAPAAQPSMRTDLAGPTAPAPPSHATIGTVPPPTIPDDEPSVRPGVNERYRKGPVDRFVERFEGPNREVAVHRDEIVAALAIDPGAVVADVGAGTGLFTFDLAEAVGPSGHVYAVDITPSFLDLLRRRASERGASNVTVVQADPKNAHLEPNTIDLAFLCEVYHHLEYPRTYLGSIYEALRPGGRLVVVDFRRDPNTSPAWVLSHVRAGEATVIEEITSVGFRFEGRTPGLSQNYVLRFRKPSEQPL